MPKTRTMKSRRDMLKAAAGIGTVTIIQASTAGAFDGQNATRDEILGAHVTSGLKAIGDEWEREKQAELLELMVYRDRLYAARRKYGENAAARGSMFEPPYGISIPMGILPMSFYARCTKRMLSIPEPKIPNLHTAFEQHWGGGASIADVCNSYAKLAKLVPYGVEVVDKFTLLDPKGKPSRADRVVSPRYVIDVDEPHFGMRTTANMIIDGVDGIANEWKSKMVAAYNAAGIAAKMSDDNEMILRTGRAVSKSTTMAKRIRMQLKPIEVSVSREAYMLEFFAYSLGTGYII